MKAKTQATSWLRLGALFSWNPSRDPGPAVRAILVRTVMVSGLLSTALGPVATQADTQGQPTSIAGGQEAANNLIKAIQRGANVGELGAGNPCSNAVILLGIMSGGPNSTPWDVLPQDHALHAQHAAASAELEPYAQAVKVAQNEKYRVKGELQKQEYEVEGLQSRIESLKESISQQKLRVRDARERLAAASSESEKESARDALAAAQAELKALEGRLKQTRSEHAQAVRRYNDLQHEAKTAEASVQTAYTNMQPYSEKVGRVNLQAATLAGAICGGQ